MFCRKCGKEFPQGTTVCPFCGNGSYTEAQINSDTGEQKNNVLAILSLITGICMMGVIPLVLGIVAQNQIKSNRFQKGSGMATAGIVLGGFSFIMWFILPVFAAILFPVFAKAREKARQTSCISNLKQLSLATSMYTQDYDSKFPLKVNWSDAMQKYVNNPRVFKCASDRSQSKCSYSYYDKLDGISIKKIKDPVMTPMLFDSVGGWNLSGPIASAISRHNGGFNTGFTDGHVKWNYHSGLSGSPANPVP